MTKQKRDYKAKALILAGICGWTMLGFQNCAPESVSGISNLSSSRTYIESDNSMEELPDLNPVGVEYSENMLKSMQFQLGVTTLSQTTRNNSTNSVSLIPETGRASSVTAPMWTGVTNLAGEVCNDLVTQEKALAMDQRRIFRAVDFTKAFKVVTKDGRADVVRRLARSAWGRNESVLELAAIDAAVVGEFSAATAANSSDFGMLFICTAMMASLEARIQ